MNEVIKQRWVALGPRNYGKSIEWKLEGEPWDTEGLYADHTRGIYLLCLLLEAIQPLGWRLVSSAGKKEHLTGKKAITAASSGVRVSTSIVGFTYLNLDLENVTKRTTRGI